jgi:hypothetical protein
MARASCLAISWPEELLKEVLVWLLHQILLNLKACRLIWAKDHLPVPLLVPLLVLRLATMLNPGRQRMVSFVRSSASSTH